jgi:hypothetical protein
MVDLNIFRLSSFQKGKYLVKNDYHIQVWLRWN